MRMLPAAAIFAIASTTTLAAEPPDACTAAAERMMQAMAEVSPTFEASLAEKSADDRAATIRATAANLDEKGACGIMLTLPDSSIRALALQGTQ